MPERRVRPNGQATATPMRWLDVPTLRLDDYGRQEAARHIAQGPKARQPPASAYERPTYQWQRTDGREREAA